MSQLPLSSRRHAAGLAAALLAGVTLSACTTGVDASTSRTAQWLRAAGNFDETPSEIACVEAAMHDLLSPDELDHWLARDPETITVEQIQALPHAIAIADRCR